MSVTALIAPGEPNASTSDAPQDGGAAEPLEIRHLTRDGRLLEVELWSRPIDFHRRPGSDESASVIIPVLIDPPAAFAAGGFFWYPTYFASAFT